MYARGGLPVRVLAKADPDVPRVGSTFKLTLAGLNAKRPTVTSREPVSLPEKR